MEPRKVILFAGTTEGRIIAEALMNHENVEIHVATDYGKNLLPESVGGFKVCQGRLDKSQMVELIKNSGQGKPLVVDATHPYAVEVTENIRAAATETDVEYFRVLRDEDSQINWRTEFKDRLIFADTIEQAGEILNELGEKALITTGSKELEPFTKVENFKELLTVRILPLEGAFKAATKAGFEGKNLIAMQGPFSVHMNRALIKQTGAKVLVTKESGHQGGFVEKLIASREEDIKVVVINRPRQETGYSVGELLKVLDDKGIKIVRPFQLGGPFAESEGQLATDKGREWNNTGENISGSASNCESKSDDESNRGKRWFPLFIDSANKNVLIVGGGKIAERRIETLCKFQCQVTVWTRQVSDKMGKMEREKSVKVEQKDISCSQVKNLDFNKFDMVIGATSDRQLNKEICQQAEAQGKFANDASCKEKCNFYFPAVSIKGDITVGINGQGNDHKLVSQVRQSIDQLLTEKIEG